MSEATKNAGVLAGRFPIAQALGVRNFRILWIGETVSLLGNQFYVVAFPWLVLRLTHSGLALGTLFMTVAIPRAILMLVGGVVADKLSPKTVMIIANGARGLVLAVLAGLIAADLVRMWQLYVLAAIYGTSDAFFFPAYKAVLPRVLDSAKMQAGNALLQGSSEAALSIGPLLIGWALAMGLSLQAALGFDALSFGVSLVTLLMIRLSDISMVASRSPDLLGSIKAGISYAAKRPTIRVFLLNMAIVNFATTGPFGIGLAVLAKDRFGSATSLGFLFSAMAAGALAGSVMAGLFPTIHKVGSALITMTLTTGVGMILLGLVAKLGFLGGVLVVMGCLNSLAGVMSASMVQSMVDPAIMGRVMSLFILSRRGIAPFSFLIAGLLIPFGVRTLFVASGVLVLVANACLLWNRRNFGALTVPEGSYVG
jgi:MFS family permease